MTDRRRLVPRLGLLVMIAGLWTPSAHALEGDTFRPLVFANYGHEDNIFRFQDGASPAAPFSRSDSYHQLGIGFDLDWKPGRQRVRANVKVNKTRFAKNYSLLDYDGQDIRLIWDWQLGNLWNGQLGHDRQRTLGSYLGLTTSGLVVPVNNVRTEDNTYFNANYRFHSRWQAGLSLRQYSADYSAAAQALSNVETDTVVMGLYYTGRAVQRIGVEARLVDGKYPARTVGSGLATAFDERFLGGVADWVVTGKSRVRARLGYVSRDNHNIAGHDHSGLEWRVDGDWTPTGKTLINGVLNREINHTDVTGASHELVSGLEVNAVWLVKPKTRLGAGVSYRNVEYDGSNRTDDIYSVNVNAGYEIWRGGNLTAQIRREKRNSTLNTVDNTHSTSLFIGASLLF
ncbi:MAG TPA: outer membrane beta-barrel protein [Thiobacillaceae bacterium]|nr:outer membrane beta-barrel protein [Thiobacillaceae bacterium]